MNLLFHDNLAFNYEARFLVQIKVTKEHSELLNHQLLSIETVTSAITAMIQLVNHSAVF